MKKIFALLLALAMLLTLAACGEKEADPHAGKYEGIYAKAFGMTMPMPEVYEGETWIELKSGGRGTICLDGDQFGLKWSLAGSDITITFDGVDSVGTLENGMIVIDLMDMGMELTFLKEGAEMPEPEATHNDSGYWDIVRLDSEDPDSCVSEEDMVYAKAYGTFAYLDLLEDGTGTLYLNEEFPITWQDGTLTDEPGLVWNYTIEGDELHLTIETNTFVFRKGEKPEPVLSELEAAGFTEYMEVGVPYEITTQCVDDETQTSVGEVTVVSYEIFESAEGYEPMEGYEWRVVKLEFRVFDENAWDYGTYGTATNTEDYYNTKLHDDTSEIVEETDTYDQDAYTIIYNGQEMEAYNFYNYPHWGDWYAGEDSDHESIYYMQWDFLVPIGYDGCVVGVRDRRVEWPDGAYITDLNPEDFRLFRLDNESATYVSSDAASDDGSIAGYYTLYAMESDGEHLDHDTVVALGMDTMVVIELNEDGTGTLTFEGETENCTYTDSEIIDDTGYACPYYMEDGFLVLNLEDNILCYCQKN